MTAPLPDRIATAIETHADLWHSCGVLANGRCAIPTPAASAKRVEAEAESKVLRDLLAELVAERDAASAEVERLVKQRNEFFRAVVRVQLLRDPFGFECLHCGGLLAVSLPISVDEFGAAANAFVVKHRDCPAPAAAAPAPSTAPRRCAKCGLAENEHDVRHVFVPAGGRR